MKPMAIRTTGSQARFPALLVIGAQHETDMSLVACPKAWAWPAATLKHYSGSVVCWIPRYLDSGLARTSQLTKDSHPKSP
jgi:hypothetical protein